MCSIDPICPACGYRFEQDEYFDNHLTYHGGGPKKDECPECGTELMIEEFVDRIFEVTLAKDTGK